MDEDKTMGNELAFLSAMRSYREAKKSGDSEAIQKAEDALRDQVRQELQESAGE